MAVAATRVGSEASDRLAAPDERAPAGRDERIRFGIYAGHLLTSWALGLSNALLALALVTAPWVGPRRLPADPRARRTLGLAGLYILLLLGAIAASRDPRVSVRALSEIFSFCTLALALAGLRGTRRIRFLIDALIVVGALLALSGLFQLLLGYGSIDRRIRGPFSHYMTFAGILLMLDLLLVARLLLRRRRESGRGPTAWLDRPLVAWLALTAINVALVVSLTRSAWLALATALAGLLAVVRPKLLLAALPAAVLFLVLAPVPLLHRVLSIADLGDASNYDRIAMAEAGARMVAERPLLGVGPDEVKHLYPLYRHRSAPRLLTPHLHNAYVQLAAERGLPALAVYLSLVGLCAAVAWRGYRRSARSSGERADLHLGVLAALVGFSIAALFENNWGDTEVQRVVLFLLAVPICLEADPGPELAE